MLNPNQDTGVDAIFGHNAEATSLVDIPVTAIAELSFFAPTNHPLTPTPLFTQLQQPPILTPATTPSSSLQNLPNFGSLFGFDNRLKALEDNFSEFKQTNQYAKALSSIPGIVDQYLANKMKEAVDVAVQLKSDKVVMSYRFITSSITTLSTYVVVSQAARMTTFFTSSKKGDFHNFGSKTLKHLASSLGLFGVKCAHLLVSNLRRRDAYTPYSDPRGFIYENKDKKNRLMRIDELHKFSDGTLDDVQTALNDPPP
ncbi:hypothetical protein Tco_0967837 [Tanacetum coccineum]